MALRIRGAGSSVSCLRRLAPATSPSNSRKLTGEQCQHFPTQLWPYSRSWSGARTTTAGRKPTRQCFCARSPLERHGVSREGSQGRRAIPPDRAPNAHTQEPARRESKRRAELYTADCTET